MRMWLIIMWTTLIATCLGLFYLSNRVNKFGFMSRLAKGHTKRQAIYSILLVFLSFYLIGFSINFMNAIVCVIYFTLLWAISDFIFGIIQKVRQKGFARYYAGGVAVLTSVLALSIGWYLDHHVWQTDYYFTTDKNIKNLKIIEFADSHTGTTFHAEGFAKHLQAMQAQNPDVVIIAGDFVDDSTSKEDMIATCQSLGQLKTTYGVYFSFGNHDKGYYGPAYRGFSSDELVAELEKNKVKVLRDEAELVDNRFYIIGRRDFSEVKEQGGHRKSMQELIQNLD